MCLESENIWVLEHLVELSLVIILTVPMQVLSVTGINPFISLFRDSGLFHTTTRT